MGFQNPLVSPKHLVHLYSLSKYLLYEHSIHPSPPISSISWHLTHLSSLPSI